MGLAMMRLDNKKGTLSEMHILYLAIENYLRIQSKLSEAPDVYRVYDVS